MYVSIHINQYFVAGKQNSMAPPFVHCNIVYACMYMYTYVYIFIYMYIHIYVYTHKYVCVNTHISAFH